MQTAATMIRGYVVPVRTLLTRGPTWQVGVDEQGRGLDGMGMTSGAVIQFRDPTMDPLHLCLLVRFTTALQQNKSQARQ